MPSNPLGRVYLVGAGPGDPGLLTLAGAQRLREADVVLYDYLANDALLRHVPASAELHCLGRHGAGKLWSQQEINARMIAEANAGKVVVRLKGGDPSIFGRIAEEVGALAKAGVSFEVVPGVTTAAAAGAYAGIAITDRDQASCVALVTGHERSDGDPSGTADFAKLASFPGTLVVYMGVVTAPKWSRRLIDAGKPADTPATIVRRCSLPDQETIATTLGQLPELLGPKQMRPPLVVVIGDVATPTAATNWFTARPLFGQTVLVTRPVGQADAMAQRLASLGARVLCQPTIEITPPASYEALDTAIARVGDYDTVVFSSRNGVEALLGRMQTLGRDARAFGGAKIAAIGRATAEALDAWRLSADLLPDEYRAEALAEALEAQAAGKRYLLVRASRGREVLAESLHAAGAVVEEVIAYESHDVSSADSKVLEEITAGRVDWITVTSSAIARSAAKLFSDAIARSPQPPRFAAISPLTAGTLGEAGYEAGAVASVFTADGVIDAILDSARELTSQCPP